MSKSRRGTSPGTRKAVAKANLRRKTERLLNELATISRSESDRLLAQSPKLLQTIFLLQEISKSGNEWSDRAFQLAEELQMLLVEQTYSEIIDDGVTTVGGSYIV